MNTETNTNEGPPDTGAPTAALNAFGLPVGAPDNRKDLLELLKAQGVNVSNNIKNTELVKMYHDRTGPLPPAGTQPILPAGNPAGVVTTPLAKPAKPAAVKAPVPPCPDEDPLKGDKTPAVIAWWHKHHPEEATAKYSGRKFETPADHE